MTLGKRFWAKVDRTGPDGCWTWKRPRGNGYGYFHLDGREQCAHRVSYEHFVGPIPDGLELDHLCRNRACINPDHLEPVTHAENVRRGEAPVRLREWHRSRTHCYRGHEFTADNTYHHPRGYRSCRQCQNERERAARRSKPKTPRPLKSHCPQGHPYTDENAYVYVKSNGATTRNCRACQRDRNRNRKDRHSGHQN